MNNITITYTDGKEMLAPQGITLAEVLSMLPPIDPAPFAAVVNGELQELSYALYTNSTIDWLDYQSDVGHRIYRRSVIFLLSIAATNVFPSKKLWVSHSLENGLYCHFKNVEITPAQICELKEEMDRIVAANLPIANHRVTRDDAVAFFTQNDESKAKLMARRTSQYINFYTCGEQTNYLFGRMALTTGLLTKYELIPFDRGFVLRLPARKYVSFPDIDFIEPKRIQATLNEYQEWHELLEIESVTDLNTVWSSDNYGKGNIVVD